jgi:N-acetylglucosaminyldiphosphoundecaprenol N-acetyl-beta-D-mannosaminyltransferase
MRLFDQVQHKGISVGVPADLAGAEWGESDTSRDDLSRRVFCVLGIPIDAIEMSAALRTVEQAVADHQTFLISTVNLNYLVNSRGSRQFRESLLLSDLCVADGLPIIWIARLMGLPIRHRVAGSDMFKAMWETDRPGNPFRLYLFGGTRDVVEAATTALNEGPRGWHCVGSISPGFGSIADMSQNHIVAEINASRADFLLVALGAKKGQLWLLHNHERLTIPVRAHLGATLNFTAGKVRRAPAAFRRWGLEWLWRIKEEPHLWKRYWNDGMTFMGLVFAHVVPFIVLARWRKPSRHSDDLVIEWIPDDETTFISLTGAAVAANVGKATSAFRTAVNRKKLIRINLANTRAIDSRFLGLLLMLRKQAAKHGTDVKFEGWSSHVRTTVRLSGADFLLGQDRKPA